MKRYVIVFDLDGTIIYSVEYHSIAFKNAVKKLGYKNYNQLYKKFKKLVGMPIEEILKILIPGINKEEVKRIEKLKTEYFLKNLKQIKLNKRLIEIIKKVRARGIKTAIFTSTSKKLTKIILKKFKIYQYFDYLVCKEDVKKHKPNAEGLIKIMKKFNTKNIIYIGDSKFDKIAAKKAKIRYIDVRKVSIEKIYKTLGID